ncbi:MAG TPA: MaoC family dehydratase [Burkholderiaceae bacterium]|nr:MaoC family dehydratase [Burkholderiaceae bacterium]
MTKYWFEDFTPGWTFENGPRTLTAQEIIAFARQWDPQRFHTDEAQARETPFGGLIASGWHTGSMMMRMLVDRYLSPATGLGSPGMDELRWTAPVRPGDRLWFRFTVIEARRSESKPDRGVIRVLMEVLNDKGAVAMSVKGMTLVRCRTAVAA